VIFDFAAGTRRRWWHSEGLTGGQFRTRPADVQVYRAAFADLCRRALPVDVSRSVSLDRAKPLVDPRRVRCSGGESAVEKGSQGA
jgi:hypothetical protein